MVNVQRLKKFNPRAVEELKSDSVSDSDSDKENEPPEISVVGPKVVSTVIDRRLGKNGYEFLIQTGSDQKWTTAPETPSKLIRDFNSKNRAQRVSARHRNQNAL